MERKEQILNTAVDLARNFLYYDRKEDEDLPTGEIEAAIKGGEITVKEIVQKFEDSLNEELKGR